MNKGQIKKSTWAFFLLRTNHKLMLSCHVICCIMCYSRPIGYEIMEQKTKVKQTLLQNVGVVH